MKKKERNNYFRKKNKMKSNPSFIYSGILLTTAALWGFSFVAQRSGMNHVGPYTFNGIRFALGAFSLLPLYLYQKKQNKKIANPIPTTGKSGLILGLVLFIAASLQQIGMQFTSAANGGFITSLYVVLVPFFSIFLNKKIDLSVWIGSVLALIGLYFLSFTNSFNLNKGDTLVLISAVFWAIHVILIGKFALKGSIVLLSMFQFGLTSFLSLITAFFLEPIIWGNIQSAGIPILYGGVVSVGIAYTLQIFAQKKVVPEKAAIILSFESAFAMLGGWLLLNESLSFRSIFGASLMLLGIIISQIKIRRKK